MPSARRPIQLTPCAQYAGPPIHRDGPSEAVNRVIHVTGILGQIVCVVRRPATLIGVAALALAAAVEWATDRRT